MRWDLLEKFEILKKGEYARAVKSFSGDEDFFGEHFPGRPLVPEPLLVEMIAQTGGVLMGLGFDFKKEVILAKITEARFLREVSPPCRLLAEAWIKEGREEGAWISGTVKHGNECVARADILLVAMDLFDQGRRRQVVFNENFLRHFDVYNVAKASENQPVESKF